MLAGYPPFYAAQPFEVYKKILTGEFECPKHFDSHAEALCSKLTKLNVKERLGCGEKGAEQIKQHKWFRGEATLASPRTSATAAHPTRASCLAPP